MGSLIVKKVMYSGDHYEYSSPTMNSGINIILGDNESGKSTFSYFIEYGLGGKIKPFVNDDVDARYSLILDDTNNYVQVDILIDEVPYSLKRFINTHDIFIDQEGEVKAYPLERKGSNFIFSDWLLDKLGIPVFELYLGAAHWYFNFNDLFRLLNYDQNTEAKKIYKEPLAENFIADSIIIRKSIFEILLGMSSAEYFRILDIAKAALKARDAAKTIYDGFIANNNGGNWDIDELNIKRANILNELTDLENQRNFELKRNTTYDDKVGELAEIQSKLVNLQLAASNDRVTISNLANEQNKISSLHEGLLREITQIEKIIFTHDKLDLFAMELCPFCMSKKDVVEGYCICGAKFTDDDYEKFVYNSNEYKDILLHKQKSIKAITLANDTYIEEMATIKSRLETTNTSIEEYTQKLKNIISTAEYAGNSTVIDDFNDRIFKLKEELSQVNSDLIGSQQKQKLKLDYDEKNSNFRIAQAHLNRAKIQYDQNNASTILQFNKTYSLLLSKSSYKSTEAYIDEDYMPFIDNKEYKAKSSEVPKRLMYYFTILSLALQLDSVKHPRFLLIDTPEDAGIDTDNLNLNLALLEEAIELSKNDEGVIKDYQVILTTGYGKFPEEFEKYIIERFSKKDGNYILKAKE